MISSKLKDIVLFQPLLNGSDELYIVSGFATPNMVSWLIKNVSATTSKRLAIHLLVGMTNNGISISDHTGFIELVKSSNNKEFSKGKITFDCGYIFDVPVHSKVYVWCKSDCPVIAFVGSANFTQTGFSDKQRECMEQTDATEAYQYYFENDKNSIYCQHVEIEDYVRLRASNPLLDIDDNIVEEDDINKLQTDSLSLLSRTGDVGQKSGINWGNRNKRNRNEAYIPLPKKTMKSGFFPTDGSHFTVITDDRKQLILRTEQQNNKAITTPLNNALLGEYLRNRLELENGAFISKDILESYGRTDITFYKFDDEQYYLDFSTNKEDN